MNNEANNENKKPVSPFKAGKGLYIVLFLCLCGIGISGYFLASGLFGQEPAVIAAAPADESQASVSPEVTASLADENVLAVMAEADLDLAAAEAAAEAASNIKIWPLSGGVSKDYSVDALVFSATTNDWRTHDGVDLAAYLGEPVMAVTAGTVAEVYDDELYGTTVIIAHEGSVSSKYSNLGSVPTVTVGQTVAAGDVIGAVGDTALLECADAPHLHLQIYKEGIAIDPAEYIGN